MPKYHYENMKNQHRRIQSIIFVCLLIKAGLIISDKDEFKIPGLK